MIGVLKQVQAKVINGTCSSEYRNISQMLQFASSMIGRNNHSIASEVMFNFTHPHLAKQSANKFVVGKSKSMATLTAAGILFVHFRLH
jgi:hypothetical protein